MRFFSLLLSEWFPLISVLTSSKLKLDLFEAALYLPTLSSQVMKKHCCILLWLVHATVMAGTISLPDPLAIQSWEESFDAKTESSEKALRSPVQRLDIARDWLWLKPAELRYGPASPKTIAAWQSRADVAREAGLKAERIQALIWIGNIWKKNDAAPTVYSIRNRFALAEAYEANHQHTLAVRTIDQALLARRH